MMSFFLPSYEFRPHDLAEASTVSKQKYFKTSGSPCNKLLIKNDRVIGQSPRRRISKLPRNYRFKNLIANPLCKMIPFIQYRKATTVVIQRFNPNLNNLRARWYFAITPLISSRD